MMEDVDGKTRTQTHDWKPNPTEDSDNDDHDIKVKIHDDEEHADIQRHFDSIFSDAFGEGNIHIHDGICSTTTTIYTILYIFQSPNNIYINIPRL